MEWSKQKDSDDYDKLEELYSALVSQYERYINHARSSIGGIYVTPKTMGEAGEVYGMVSKAKQKEALDFIEAHIFKEPKWILDDAILNKIKSPQSKDYLVKNMEAMMSSLLNGGVVSRMGFIAERYESKTDTLETDDVKPTKVKKQRENEELIEVYRPEEYLDDIYQMVWKDLGRGFKPTIYERHVQKAYLTNMIALYRPEKAKKGLMGLMAILSNSLTVNTDTRALALSYLSNLHEDIKKTLPRISDRMTKAHLQYMEKQIEDVFREEMVLE